MNDDVTDGLRLAQRIVKVSGYLKGPGPARHFAELAPIAATLRRAFDRVGPRSRPLRRARRYAGSAALPTLNRPAMAASNPTMNTA